MNESFFSKITSLFAITDEQAMGRVQAQDDAEAFAQLVSRWQQPIRNLCTRMLGDLHRGEDLAQETFVRLYARRESYQPTAKFSTYLWRIALNVCYGFFAVFGGIRIEGSGACPRRSRAW